MHRRVCSVCAFVHLLYTDLFHVKNMLLYVFVLVHNAISHCVLEDALIVVSEQLAPSTFSSPAAFRLGRISIQPCLKTHLDAV